MGFFSAVVGKIVEKIVEKATDHFFTRIVNGVLDTVTHRAPASDIWFKSTTVYENFESRRLVFEEIMEALRDDKIYIIGIHGAGGVGKTKMAEEIGKQAKENKLFDEVAMTSVSQNPDVRRIQGELAACLNLKLDTEAENKREGQLCNRLQNGKKILVIIDDVWNQINLKEIGILFVDNIKNCKIVLTSRSSSVCHQMGVQKCVPIGFLSEHEAWDLFKKKVKNLIDSPEMESVAKQVCRECAGLPLAILAVGGVLMNYRNKETWEDALEQLRNSKLSNIEGMEVHSRIELSYKFLKSADVKSCFLLCCLFQEDTQISIDDLVRYGVGMRCLRNLDTMEKARNRVHMLVDTLKTSSLLLEGRDQNMVKMHDVIRDVAISIASKEEYGFLVTTGAKEWPEKDEYERCKVLSLWFKNIYELPNELECPELHTLVLDCNNPSLKVPNGFFNGMKKLNVLHLSNMHISSLPKLVNLRMLCLNNCRFEDMALLIMELPKLEILSLVGSSIKELALEIRQLTHLRVLDLRKCYNLVIFPSHVISNLSRLEELCIPDEFNGWEVETSKKKIRNASLVELNSLIQLINLEIHIPNVMLLPKDLRFESLKRFKISVGESFERTMLDSLYEYFNSSGTRMLKLAGVPLKDEFNILMERAEGLYLENLEGLRKVLHEKNGEGFFELKYLYVENCNDMNHLLSKPKLSSQYQGRCSGPFCKLKVLVVKNCRLKYLFSLTTVKGLPQLQELTIRNCECMEVVVRDDEEVMEKIIFHQLKEMHLDSLLNLRSLCDNMKIMSNMEGSPSNHGKTLFNKKVAFPALEQLYIYNCGLKYMFSHAIARDLSQLEQLEIYDCKDMENIVENDEEVKEKIIFHQLKKMALESLPNLRSFYDNTKMRTTVEASPSNLGQALFNDKVAFLVLEDLYIEGLENIREIWDNQSILPPEEEFFCSNSFSKLSILKVSDCGWKYMFSHVIARGLSQLQELEIHYCEDMENIVENDEEVKEKIIFHQLKKMILEGLPNLRSFYDSTKMRTTVEANSSNLGQALFNDKVAFPVLEELCIEGLENIREIWDNQSILPPQEKSFCSNSFSKLSELEVSNCGLKYMFSHAIARGLSQLQKLKIDDCEDMKNIVKNDEEVKEKIIFHQLKEMTLVSLPNLRSFYDSTKMRTTVEASPSNLGQALFNDKVVFPVLEKLSIWNLENTREIWGNQSIFPPEEESFCSNSLSKLSQLEVGNCGLKYLFSHAIARGLLQLQELKIYCCEDMENIVKNDEEVKEKIVFHQLKEMTLVSLPNLRSFYDSTKMRTTVEASPSNLGQALFNDKVKFPCLKDLRIYKLDKVNEIWCSTVPNNSICKLKRLRVRNCGSLEEVFKVEGPYAGEGIVARDETPGRRELRSNLLFPRLQSVDLEDLPQLMSFYSGCCISELCFLVEVRILRCPKLDPTHN